MTSVYVRRQGALQQEAHIIDVHVGQRVRERRVLIGASQEELGKSVGLTFQQVQKYERGANRISAGRLVQIARFLSVPVQFFFDGLNITDGEAALGNISRRERIITFALTCEGIEWNEAYLNAPSARCRKLAKEILDVAAKPND